MTKNEILEACIAVKKTNSFQPMNNLTSNHNTDLSKTSGNKLDNELDFTTLPDAPIK